MANFTSDKMLTDLMNKVNELELKLQQKEDDGKVKPEPEQKSRVEVFTWEVPKMSGATTAVNVTSPVYSLQAFPIGFKVKLVYGTEIRPASRPPLQAGRHSILALSAAAPPVAAPPAAVPPAAVAFKKELSFSLAFASTDYQEALATLPFYPTVTYTVCDISGNEHLQDFVRIVEKPFGTIPRKYDEFGYDADFNFASLQSPRYLSFGDKLTIKIGVSFDNPNRKEDIVKWKVGHYWMKRFLYMNSFVDCYPVKCIETHNKGYRVRIQQHIGDTFSISVQFLTGEYDKHLNPVFPHVTTVVVENQWDPSPDKHLVKSVVKAANNVQDIYILEIATHKELKSGGYLVDDTLKIKFIISAI